MTQTRPWIDVPGAPDIPGRRFCLYSVEEDTPAMVEAANAFDTANGDLYERHRYAADRSASEWHKPLEL